MSTAATHRLRPRLELLYGPEQAPAVLAEIEALVARYRGRLPQTHPAGWDERDALLITYGDSLLAPGQPPLTVLHQFLRRYTGHRLSFVHLLPFYPWSSDDGFAVKDFRAVNPALGGWDEIAALARDYRLVFDGVINHVSSVGTYAQGYLAGDPAYADFFIDVPPGTDTSSVLRTRNLPLIHEYPRADGSTARLWTTFGPDQLDLNFANPRVLLEVLDVLLEYAARSAAGLRLDAIPYLWKRLGTSCAHLPETHQVIKLIRDVYDAADARVLLLTETNVPHHENVSYFGDAGDEAQLIYNFSLPPLIVHSILTGDASVLADWARGVRFVSPRASYLNITATHDGIGMRPTEGLLSEPQRQALMDLARARGGDVTGKRNSDGSISPYELNLNYFDAVNDPASNEPRDLQVRRFLLSQAIPLAFIGIPGIYLHSLLGSRNDLAGVARSGRARSINREQLQLPTLETELADPHSLRAEVLRGYRELLDRRQAEPAFHPDQEQEVLHLDRRVLALRRFGDRGEVLALHNVSGDPLAPALPPGTWRDLADDQTITGTAPLGPWHHRWLRRQP